MEIDKNTSTEKKRKTAEERKQEFIREHAEYINNLKSPNAVQKKFIEFYQAPNLSDEDKKKFDKIIKSEQAIIKARKLTASANLIINEEKKQERKARNHNIFNAGGLLGLAGLLDKKTGRMEIDKVDLLARLLRIKEINITDFDKEKAISLLNPKKTELGNNNNG